MKIITFVLIMFMPLLGMLVHQMYLIEVDPLDFVCQRNKQIKGSPEDLFRFLTTSLAIEKLLPWLTRFREADKRLVAPGKSYSAYVKFPIFGEERAYATLTNYKPSKQLTFEFDDLMKQNVAIQTLGYHDRTLLQASVYSRRTSMLYQYTIGYVMRWMMKDQLEKSMKNFAILYESLDGPDEIPNFSKTLI